ncbi:MAG: alpha-mannosidase [Nitrososphaerota archaeon]|nr:alpha-mannosidase [Nitrososphaerota archaeon]MDG6953023.1 alpha-mannosidase [Nitrososphaerota archaeon]MDG6957647.1 alpha-mannosidase [Nitrososphaerota archaeon]MDG6969187.1 alpha-mannosidase [Nitrososphaerota archaeon]MDG6971933.1 alpha-mannosidase [Nitrososphaerota archaeon]
MATEGTVTGQEDARGTVHFLGHSHLDAAWLWSFEETKRVLGEGCENVLGLLEKHHFTFCQSSAQYYKWLEEEHPGTFEKVRKRVKEGSWEIVGGAWVESDANMPSGEALVRQYLLGKRYFARKFGVDVKVAWYPDSFGFPWTLPQIMRRSGMEFFLTQKLNWNDTVAFPHYFFRWTSPDGSSILAHEMVGAYDERVEEVRILDQLRRLKARHQVEDLLVLFGEGDHGGGVSDEMVQRALGFVRGERPVKGRFAASEDYLKRAAGKLGMAGLPEVKDELYFQFHRGTYTTQARTKRNNRKAECLLEAAEKFATVAHLEGLPYPAGELNEAWERLLLNQFHDVLPGSSVPEVYADSQKDFDWVFATANRLVSESLKAISYQADTSGEGRPILVFNPLSWSRSGLVELPAGALMEGDAVTDCEGQVVASQMVDGGKLIFRADDVPPVGYKEYRAAPAGGKPPKTTLTVEEGKGEVRLENEHLSVAVDRKTGLVKSVTDKDARREALKGPGGVIQIFEDAPVKGRTCVSSRTDAAIFDAWEVFIYQQEGGVRRVELDAPDEVKLVESGPVRARIRTVYRYSQKGREDSLFAQEVVLCAGSPLVEFKLDVDWHAEHRLAKVAFPLAVHGDFTTYEIPYGHITRRNPVSPEATLVERSKYEAPGQKWIDHGSEDGAYGVSLLNDCKYGFDVANDVMRMTLLRSAEYPFRLRAGFGLPPVEGAEGQLTDQGIHEAAYALYPHASGFGEALTARKAYEFNYPLMPLVAESHQGRLPKSMSFVSAHPDNVILTVLKKAEDSDAVVLRLYETSGRAAEAAIRLAWPIEGAASTNLLEGYEREVSTEGGKIAQEVSASEIATVRVDLKRPSRT